MKLILNPKTTIHSLPPPHSPSVNLYIDLTPMRKDLRHHTINAFFNPIVKSREGFRISFT